MYFSILLNSNTIFEMMIDFLLDNARTPSRSAQMTAVTPTSSSPEHGVSEMQRKREDMDRVICELTKAVMKSRNVTTLTRAMRNKYSSSSETQQQLVLASSQESSSAGSGRSSRRGQRRNPLRNSIRKLRSISKGTKGSVDVVKNLWQQVSERVSLITILENYQALP